MSFSSAGPGASGARKHWLDVRESKSSTPEPTPADEVGRSGAFAVRVGCYAGHRYPERPLWVELDGRRVDVTSVDSEWREEGRLGFAVTLSDARRLLLYYVPNEDDWSGVVLA